MYTKHRPELSPVFASCPLAKCKVREKTNSRKIKCVKRLSDLGYIASPQISAICLTQFLNF